MNNQAIKIDYTNWKNERSVRTIVPERIFSVLQNITKSHPKNLT